MTYIVTGGGDPERDILLANMFRERKRVFVDLLGWDVPVLGGEFELDQFDGASTIYLLIAGPLGEHLGSMRLLPTDGPTILGAIFPFLSDSPVPASGCCWEISRFCLSRNLRAMQRRLIRDQLVTAAVGFALERGVSCYVCVADMSWLSQIPDFGWRCDPLGLPQQLHCGLTGAMRIDITPNTPELMRVAGTWRPSSRTVTEQLAA